MGRRWARLRRRLVRRMAEAGPVGGILAALLSLNKARNYDCEDVFRETAFAAEPRLEPRWSTPQQYRNEDGSVVVAAPRAAFSGTPTIREVREHYGITPAEG